MTTYALITPARDEEENLRRLAGSILAQTVRPAAWVIVDNGSVDGTAAFVRELAAEHAWVTLASAPAADRARPGPPVVVAFHEGLRHLAEPVDVVVKLDADVSFDADYVERLLDAFAADPRLGIASGDLLELDKGEWHRVISTGAHVRGATRAYRWECLQQLLPLPDSLGWDTVDEVKATILGWTTLTLDDVFFRHHRKLGARDGAAWARWAAQGRASYYLGYRPSYVTLRALRRSVRRPAAVGMIAAYTASAVRRVPQHPDVEVRESIRAQQRLADLPRRALETLGRR